MPEERGGGGATRSGRFWTVLAAQFPEVRVYDLDLARAKAQLAKRLVPHVERLRRLAR